MMIKLVLCTVKSLITAISNNCNCSRYCGSKARIIKMNLLTVLLLCSVSKNLLINQD